MVLRYNDMAYVSGSSVDQMALVAVSSRLPLLGFYSSTQVNHVSDLRQECGLGFVYLWFPRPSLSNSLVPSPTSGRHFVTGTCLCLSVESEMGLGTRRTAATILRKAGWV